ncbi:hypothetical protein [Streptomyces sp. NPDC085937]
MCDRDRRGGWRKFRVGCIVVAGAMTATYWTLRVVEAGVDLYGTAGPWV